MRREMDPAVKKLLDDTNQIVNILRGSTRIKLHDWTGEELALFIQIPKGNEKLRQAAVDYLVAAIQKNLYSITLDAIMEVQGRTVDRVTLRPLEEVV